jgi:hypothetical protein
MGEIYAAAQLTIVAAAGDNSDYGLPGVRSSSRGIATSGEHVGLVHLLVYPGQSAAKQILYTKWIRRAWVMKPYPIQISAVCQRVSEKNFNSGRKLMRSKVFKIVLTFL